MEKPARDKELLKLLDNQLKKISKDKQLVKQWKNIQEEFTREKDILDSLILDEKEKNKRLKLLRFKKAKNEEEFISEHTSLKINVLRNRKSDKHYLDLCLGDLFIVDKGNRSSFFDLKVGESPEYCGSISNSSYKNFYDYGLYLMINSEFTKWYIIEKWMLEDAKERGIVDFEGDAILEFKGKGYVNLIGVYGVIYTDLR